MTPPFCPHCGQPYHGGARFCPNSGATITPPPEPAPRAPQAQQPAQPPQAVQPVPQQQAGWQPPPMPMPQFPQVPPPQAGAHAPADAATAAVTAAGQGAWAVVGQAFDIYRRHFVALAIVAAVGLVPIRIVADLLTGGAAAAAEGYGDEMEDLSRQLRRGDITLQEYAARARGLTREVASDAGGLVGGWLAEVLASLLLFGLGLPLVQGAITAAVARKVAGGDISAGAAWGKAAARLVPLVVTGLLVGLGIGIGLILLIVPGLVVALFLCFSSTVVMLEGKMAFSALGRSASLVKRDWLRTLLALIMAAIAVAVAGWIAGLLASPLSGVPVVGSVVHAGIMALLLPFPLVAIVLLYFDLRRAEGVAPAEAAAAAT